MAKGRSTRKRLIGSVHSHTKRRERILPGSKLHGDLEGFWRLRHPKEPFTLEKGLRAVSWEAADRYARAVEGGAPKKAAPRTAGRRSRVIRKDHIKKRLDGHIPTNKPLSGTYTHKLLQMWYAKHVRRPFDLQDALRRFGFRQKYNIAMRNRKRNRQKGRGGQ